MKPSRSPEVGQKHLLTEELARQAGLEEMATLYASRHMVSLPTGTVTFLFTDIESSTALLKQLGRDRYEQALAEHAAILKSATDAYGGKLVDTQGDSSFVAFAAARDAVAAASSAQLGLGAHEWPNGVTVKVRMGLHSGEPKASGERYVGIGVHRASRIGSAAHGGQVLLSSATRELVEDDLPDGVILRDLGLYRLKDIDRPERISQVVAEGLQVEFPPLRGADPVAPPKQPVLRRRSVLASALAGVLAAAVAIPVFALGQGSAGVSQAESLLQVDPAKATVTRGIDVPGRPAGVTTCAASVFVSSLNGFVYEIDPRTAKPYPIFVGGSPGDISHVGGLATVLTKQARNKMYVIDSGAGQAATTFALPGSPASQASIAVYGVDVYVANPNTRSLERISSPYTGLSRRSISLPPLSSVKEGLGYSGLAAGGGFLWIAGNYIDRTLLRVNLKTGHVTTIRLHFPPRAIAYGPGGLWLVDQRDNAVYRLNPTTGKAGPVIRVGHEPNAITVGDGFVWVTNALDGTVSRIDPSTQSVKSAKIGGKPIAIAVGLGAVWVLRQTA
jgi:class 3 adenylate cyclase/DNA-binding beta-propeller fold protein YncE